MGWVGLSWVGLGWVQAMKIGVFYSDVHLWVHNNNAPALAHLSAWGTSSCPNRRQRWECCHLSKTLNIFTRFSLLSFGHTIQTLFVIWHKTFTKSKQGISETNLQMFNLLYRKLWWNAAQIRSMNYQLLCTWNVCSHHQRRLKTEREWQ